LGAAGAASIWPQLAAAQARRPTRANAHWLPSAREALRWHAIKDRHGPALTGNVSWRHFMSFLEAKLGQYGCVDIHRAPWVFTRLETSLWPDQSKWGLSVDGGAFDIANVAANCGLTALEGVSAPLVLWDRDNPPDVRGKIVVFRPPVRASVREAFTGADYERATAFDSYPTEGQAVPQIHAGVDSISPYVWDEMTSTSLFIRQMREAGPVGVVFALNLNRAASAGLYTFPVPDHYGFPALYLDRAHGERLIEDALAAKSATLRVEGAHIASEAFQLCAFLPGRDYGTVRDEQILLRTHSDGPSISQDNGALGWA
jgi:hypothetical protein